MSGEDDAVNIAVLATEVRLLREQVTALSALVREQQQTYVTTLLWEHRNRAVDQVHANLGREIGELRVELRSRRVSWPAVGAFAVAAGALLLQLIGALQR